MSSQGDSLMVFVRSPGVRIHLEDTSVDVLAVKEALRLQRSHSGLHVVSDTAVAANLLDIVSQWTSREQVEARLATLQLPWTARLFGRRKHLVDWTARDSMWERWSTITDALKANASKPGMLLLRQTE